jgi:hypothetical protein
VNEWTEAIEPIPPEAFPVHLYYRDPPVTIVRVRLIEVRVKRSVIDSW